MKNKLKNLKKIFKDYQNLKKIPKNQLYKE